MIICTYTMALDEDNDYTNIAGIIKVVDDDNGIITVLCKAKKDDIREFNIKISKGTSSIFVRDVKGLLSVENIKELIPGDDVSIKCRWIKDEYETVEIEKREKVKNVISIENNMP